VPPGEPTPPPTPTPQPTPPTDGLGTPGPQALAAAEAPCTERGASDFTCIRLTVPLDHFAPGTARTDVTFAIRRHTAPGEARGTLVVAHTEPGESGIATANALAAELGPSIQARWDIVVPDRRGTGASGAFDCPDAATAWLATDLTGPDDALVTAAADFTRTCIEESDADPAQLRFLGSRHAAEDLEALRLYLGEDQLTLFGASDGATWLQQYAATHKEQVASLVLDAPLDPATGSTDLWVETARAADNTLAATLLACTTTPACARDVRGGQAGAAYDAIAQRLAAGPVMVNVPTDTGEPREVAVTLADLVRVAGAYVDTEQDRMLLQRAIAAASNDRWWHLARMAALVRREPSNTSLAARYATACADRGLLAGSGDPAAEWLRIGRDTGVGATRVAGLWATDLPCATWPATPEAPLQPVADQPFLVTVMGATLDPVTPWANGERIARRASARRTATILTAGGSHRTYGQGRTCPDRAITAYLSVGREPPAKGSCDGSVTAGYQSLAIATKNRLGGTRAAMSSADRELVHSVDRLAWDSRGELRIGCPNGGSVTFSAGSGATDLRLRACAFTAGVPLTGTGTIANGNDAVTLEVDSGASGGTVTYRRTGRGAVDIAGRLASVD
jgi:pimeloyl-ACP methyl ester carboxylesterase